MFLAECAKYWEKSMQIDWFACVMWFTLTESHCGKCICVCNEVHQTMHLLIRHFFRKCAALLQNVGILQRAKVFNILTVVKVNDLKKTVWRCVGECCGGAAPLFVFGFRIGPFIAKQWVTQQLVSSAKTTAKQRFGEDQKGWRDGEKEERMMAEAKRWQNTFFFVIFFFFFHFFP